MHTHEIRDFHTQINGFHWRETLLHGTLYRRVLFFCLMFCHFFLFPGNVFPPERNGTETRGFHSIFHLSKSSSHQWSTKSTCKITKQASFQSLPRATPGQCVDSVKSSWVNYRLLTDVRLLQVSWVMSHVLFYFQYGTLLDVYGKCWKISHYFTRFRQLVRWDFSLCYECAANNGIKLRNSRRRRNNAVSS